jgi:hypothetical protein
MAYHLAAMADGVAIAMAKPWRPGSEQNRPRPPPSPANIDLPMLADSEIAARTIRPKGESRNARQSLPRPTDDARQHAGARRAVIMGRLSGTVQAISMELSGRPFAVSAAMA